MNTRRTACLASTAVALAIGSPAIAQDADERDDSVSQPDGVGEIIVTAQRREQSLQDVPVAVTALSSEALQKSGVTDIGTLGAVSPGLVMTTSRASVTPYLRGVGTAAGDPGGSASVAIYIDGVYVNAPAAGFFSLNNIERLEVIKGPQGTLFGRNATGGLIHIITRTPSYTPSGELSVGYGNYDTLTGSLYATTGITENLAADVSVYGIYQHDGYGRNLTTGTDVHYRREFALRSKWLWEVGPETSFTLAGDYSENENDAGHFRTIVPGTLGVGGTPFAGTIYDTQANLPSAVDASQAGVSLRAEHDLGAVTLASTTAFRNVKSTANFDQDGTPIPRVDAVFGESTDTFQQELTATGDAGIFGYTAGLFFFDMKAETTPISIRSDVIAPLRLDRFAEQTATSYAAFGQVTAAVTDTTNITAGFRYSVDKIGISARDIAAANNPRGPVGSVIGTTEGGPNEEGKTFNSPTWRFAIDQEIGDALLYASYSRGFKAGQYNVNSYNNPAVRPEELDAWEIGLKSDLFDRQLRLNLAAFLYKYRDIQLLRVEVGAPTLVNAAAAEIKGVDVEAVWAPRFAHGFRLSASASFLDGEYTSFPNAPTFTPSPSGGNVPAVIDATGFDTIRTPEFSGNVTADYTFDMGQSELNLSATYFHSSSFFFDPDNRTVQSAYDLLNAQVTYTFPGDSIFVRAWGKNLTDEVYYSTWSSSTLGELIVAAPPRTYGLAAGIRW